MISEMAGSVSSPTTVQSRTSSLAEYRSHRPSLDSVRKSVAIEVHCPLRPFRLRSFRLRPFRLRPVFGLRVSLKLRIC